MSSSLKVIAHAMPILIVLLFGPSLRSDEVADIGKDKQETHKRSLDRKKTFLAKFKEILVGKTLYLNGAQRENCSFLESENFKTVADYAQDPYDELEIAKLSYAHRREYKAISKDSEPTPFSPVTVKDINFDHFPGFSPSFLKKPEDKILSFDLLLLVSDGKQEFVVSGTNVQDADAAMLSLENILFSARTARGGSLNCLVPYDPKQKFKFSKSDWDKILARKIWTGMTADAFLLARGKPREINTTVVRGHKTEQWVGFDDDFYYFEGGKLTSWQK